MIPTLYDKTGAVKIGDLTDTIECLVEEERNGIFELTMICPANSSILESIVYDNIIVADANDYLKSQKFRIYNTRKLMANRIEVCARHISFDLAHDWVDSISIENQSCEYALNTIFRNSQFSKHFKGHSDIVNAQNFKVNKVTCLEAIGGTDGSIIDTYGTGAEILRDNTDIHVLNRRGHDNDVTIEYRKNLTGLEVEEDTTDLVTRIMPYAIYTNSNNEEVEVRGDFINSPLINNYAHPYVKYMDYSEEFEDGEVPTKTKLNNLATKEYTINKIDIPKCNYKIEFIPLSKCAGYEGLEDRINLCDVVTVKDSRYNIDTQAKVIKVVFDVLRGRYDSMELGEPRTTLGDIIGGTGDGPIQGPPGPPGPQGPAGADGSIGDFPESLPTVPQITAKVYGFANIELSWTFENKVYYSYELYASKTKGFTPNAFNLIFSGQASTYLYQAEPNETWYFRACALNTHGQRTEFSEEVEVSTVKISDLSNYVESAAIGDALIGELNLGRGWYGELRGNYIDARQLSVTDGNGKRTLDIDSFGNVNLDVASLKIKSSSVATESFVSGVRDDVDKTVSNLTRRLDSAESKITDQAITNVVKQNFYTKNELTSSGTCNLLKNGGFENGTNYWSRNGNFTDGPDSWFPYGTGESWVIWADNARCGFYQFFNCTVGKQYSWSLDIYIERGQVQGGIENINTHWYDADSGWVKMSGTFTATSTSHAFIIYSTVNNTVFHVDNAMVNEGTIPLPFQPNYLEVDENITNLTQRVTEAESKITADAITNTVKQSFYTKAETESAITSKGYATESQLQQTANNITSTVSQNYYTKQETENTINNKNFATKSEVQQTADNITYKFSQSGGYNLVRNGNPKPWHEQYWWVTQNGWWYREASDLGIQTTDTNEAYAGTSVFNVDSDTTYSFSCWLMVEANTKGTDVYFVGSQNGSDTYDEVIHLYHGDDYNNWVHVKATFTTGSNIKYGSIRIDNNGRKDTSNDDSTVVFFSEVMLVKGAECYPQWSPNPNEVYDGITEINRDGIKVTSSNMNGHTQMSSGGFYVNRNGSDVFKVDGGGLSLRGCGANSGRYIKIENEDYTVWNNNINCLRFGYKNWNGWDGVPEFLMGYKGFRYSESTNTGEDASYFGMQTWGRGVKNNNNYAYHDIYYRSDKFGDQSHLRFSEDGLSQLRSLKKIELKAGSDSYIVADKDSGLSFPQGVNTFGINDTIWLKNSNFGITWGKYTGKEEYNLRPTTTAPVDLGHESYRYRTIYATNGSINTSDISLKENINPIVSKAETPMLLPDEAKAALSAEDYYEFVKSMPFYTYDYKTKDDEENRALHNVGFIAQDIADTAVGNEFVFKGEDGVYQYNMQGYVGVLAVALQNAIKEIETLKEEIRQLKTTF